LSPPQPSKFPPFVASRKDIRQMPVRRYVRRFASTPLFQENYQAHIDEADMKRIVRNWKRLGFGCSSDEIAAASLTYDLSVGVSEKLRQKVLEANKKASLAMSSSLSLGVDSSGERAKRASLVIEDCEASDPLLTHSCSRASLNGVVVTPPENVVSVPVSHNQVDCNGVVNLYAVSFSHLQQTLYNRDGVKQIEPVVYAPPIIPGLMQHSEALMHLEPAGQLLNRQKNKFDMKMLRLPPPKASQNVMRQHQQQQHSLTQALNKNVNGVKCNFGMLGNGMMLSTKEAALIASETVTDTAPYRHVGGDADSMVLYVNKEAANIKNNKKRTRSANNNLNRQQMEDDIYYESPEDMEARTRAEARQILVNKQLKIVSEVALQNR